MITIIAKSTMRMLRNQNKPSISIFSTNKSSSKWWNSWLLFYLFAMKYAIKVNVHRFLSKQLFVSFKHTLLFYLISLQFPCLLHYLTSHVICFSTLGKFLLIMHTRPFIKWAFCWFLFVLIFFFCSCNEEAFATC